MSVVTQKLTYYQKNRDTILQKAKEHYEKNKAQKKEYWSNRYHNMTDEERGKVNKYQRNRYCNLD